MSHIDTKRSTAILKANLKRMIPPTTEVEVSQGESSVRIPQDASIEGKEANNKHIKTKRLCHGVYHLAYRGGVKFVRELG